MLQLKNISKSYSIGDLEVEVLKGVDLAVEKGDMLAVMGSSGCGKSTLMNIIGFLDTPSGGQYWFEGRETGGLDDDQASEIRNRKLGFVFQQFNLLPGLSALKNVALPLLYQGVPERERTERGREILERVGMGDRAEHRPAQLSGGQQQRVAIGRALIVRPSLILADEPTGALDEQVTGEIMELFIKLNRDHGITITIITHDPQIAAQCTRKVHMLDGVLEPWE